MSKVKKNLKTNNEKITSIKDIKNKSKAYVLFYASWCPYSQRFLPIFKEYQKNNPTNCLCIDVEDQTAVCEEYKIDYYPTVICFKKGKIEKRLDAKPGIGLNKKQLKDLTED